METTDNSGKKLWQPSWKGVIITLLVGSNIILIRIIEALVYKGQSLENEISQWKQQWMNITNSSAGIKKQLCENINEKPAGCTVCPDGWLRHGENCYYFSSGREYRTWNESREVCEGMGADLLVIEDWEQQEFIKRFSRLQAGQERENFWIGLYRDGDGWRWVDGRLYNTGPFQITGESTDSCVQIHATAGYRKDRCQSKHNWICQKRVLKI